MTADTTVRTTLLIIAAIAIFWTLYVTRHLLAPFALAIFIWLAIDAFARWIEAADLLLRERIDITTEAL